MAEAILPKLTDSLRDLLKHRDGIGGHAKEMPAATDPGTKHHAALGSRWRRTAPWRDVDLLATRNRGFDPMITAIS